MVLPPTGIVPSTRTTKTSGMMEGSTKEERQQARQIYNAVILDATGNFYFQLMNEVFFCAAVMVAVLIKATLPP